MILFNIMNNLNFSWIKVGIIAGSSFPFTKSDFEFLYSQGIKTIVKLTSDTYYVSENILNKFNVFEIKIPDFSPPSHNNIKEFERIIDRNYYPIVIHCYAGCGRTGTMLAIWLIYTGKIKDGMSAINYIRSIRPCSIETAEQEQIIINYAISKSRTTNY